MLAFDSFTLLCFVLLSLETCVLLLSCHLPCMFVSAVQAQVGSHGLVHRVPKLRAALTPGCDVMAVRHAGAVSRDGDYAAVALADDP
jgi:hypothetical protein